MSAYKPFLFSLLDKVVFFRLTDFSTDHPVSLIMHMHIQLHTYTRAHIHTHSHSIPTPAGYLIFFVKYNEDQTARP